MFDIQLRLLKDRYIDALCTLIPSFVTPLQVTLLAFIAGCASCCCAAIGHPIVAVIFWFLNRLLDCLDGAIARKRQQASNFGGFIDLLCDFVIYSAIPISCALSRVAISNQSLWLSVSVVEASFHVNNFVLFYIAAVIEKSKAKAEGAKEHSAARKQVKELTSVAMKPALIEGFESGMFFTLMLAFPWATELFCWTLAILVSIGICQRVFWVSSAMS